MATGDTSSIRRAGMIVPLYCDAAVASSVASRDAFLPPPGYRLVSVRSSFNVASTSLTFQVRKITNNADPAAAAGATVIELLSAASAQGLLSGTARTAVNNGLVNTSGALNFKEGDRVAVLFAGTATNLTGGLIQLEFVSANRYGAN